MTLDKPPTIHKLARQAPKSIDTHFDPIARNSPLALVARLTTTMASIARRNASYAAAGACPPIAKKTDSA